MRKFKFGREVWFLIAGIIAGFALCFSSFMLVAYADEPPDPADGELIGGMTGDDLSDEPGETSADPIEEDTVPLPGESPHGDGDTERSEEGPHDREGYPREIIRESDPAALEKILDILESMTAQEAAPAVTETPQALFQRLNSSAEARRITDAAARQALSHAIDIKETGWDAVYFYRESSVIEPYILMYMFVSGVTPVHGTMTLGLRVFPDGTFESAGIRWSVPGFSGDGLLLSQSNDYADYYLESVSDIKLDIPVELWAVITAPDTGNGGLGLDGDFQSFLAVSLGFMGGALVISNFVRGIGSHD